MPVPIDLAAESNVPVARIAEADTALRELQKEARGERMGDDSEEEIEGVLADTDDYIDVTMGLIEMVVADGRFIIERDYRVKGEVWRVHLTDADPYPSKPHAHCIDGRDRFKGLTLHLGTRELYRGRQPLGRYLSQAQFDRLIEMIQPKFPDIELPLTE
jgi:chorismate-pyruvate lyase